MIASSAFLASSKETGRFNGIARRVPLSGRNGLFDGAQSTGQGALMTRNSSWKSITNNGV
jgi:hypothetical protein